MKMTKFKHAIAALAIFALSGATTALACTGIELKAADGTYVNGRTLEFGQPLQLSLMVIPRNYSFKGTLPDNTAGMSYNAKYAAVGANVFAAPALMDGLNEKGLVVGSFYFPGYAGYSTITSENKTKALSATEFPNWILTQFATVAEVKQGIAAAVIAPTVVPGWGGAPPLHYVVYDKSGQSIVIEPVNGQFKVYDNPLGVLTNSPSFDWQMTNLANYINLSPINALPVNVDGVKLQVFGQGSGLHGLPGDFTPPSRFVRAAIFSKTAVPAANADTAVLQAFHILNQFDIPVGSVEEKAGNQVAYDTTLATVVKDPNSLKYYMRTFADQNIRMVDLNKFDLNAKNLQVISVAGAQTITDISNTAKDMATK